MQKHELKKSDLAQLAGVSKAIVTRWFKRGEQADFVNVESKTLMKLSKALHVSQCRLLEKRLSLHPYQTGFLWDSLYDNMETFLIAVAQKRLVALARLVEVLGLQEAHTVAGDVVFKRFHEYKKLIKPIRRRQLEVLWTICYQA